MDKKAVLIVGMVVVVAAGVGIWWMKSGPPVVPSTPVPSTPPVVTKPVPVVAYTPVEQYQQELVSIKQEYESSTIALGATAQVRSGRQKEWLAQVQKTTEKILRLSVPAESREIHQNRIMAFYGLSSAIQTPVVNTAAVAQYETAIAALWK